MKKSTFKFVSLALSAMVFSVSVSAIVYPGGTPITDGPTVMLAQAPVYASVLPTNENTVPSIDISKLEKLSLRTIQIVDKNGIPVVNAKVNASIIDAQGFDSLIARTTNLDGIITLPEVYETPYSIVVMTKSGYEDGFVTYADHTFTYTPKKIPLTLDGKSPTVMIKLDNYDTTNESKISTNKLVKTEYTITDKNGKALPNIWVKIASSSNGIIMETRIGYPNGTFGGEGYTDKDGKITVYSKPLAKPSTEEYERAIMLYQRDNTTEGTKNQNENHFVKVVQDNKDKAFTVVTELPNSYIAFNS